MSWRARKSSFIPPSPIDIAVIRATYADERGNCTFEREGVYAEALAQAQAAHNSGGRVIVQVEKVVSYGCLDARLIRLPGIYVDALVVARPENHMQTFGTQYDPAFSGEIRTPLNALSPLPMGARKIIARRAAMELTPCAVTNLGIGMPEGVASVAAEEGLESMVLTTEVGAVGGVRPAVWILAPPPMWTAFWSSRFNSTFMTGADWIRHFSAWPKWTGTGM